MAPVAGEAPADSAGANCFFSILFHLVPFGSLLFSLSIGFHIVLLVHLVPLIFPLFPFISFASICFHFVSILFPFCCNFVSILFPFLASPAALPLLSGNSFKLHKWCSQSQAAPGLRLLQAAPGSKLLQAAPGLRLLQAAPGSKLLPAKADTRL